MAGRTKKPEPVEATGTPLTQKTVDAILAADPKTGRNAIAADLGIPSAQVWAVRTAAGMTKVSADAKGYCLARVARAGVVIPAPKKVRAPRAKATKAA